MYCVSCDVNRSSSVTVTQKTVFFTMLHCMILDFFSKAFSNPIYHFFKTTLRSRRVREFLQLIDCFKLHKFNKISMKVYDSR